VEAVERSLYERLGGVEAITAVTRAFEERAAKDDRINQKFARTNLDRLTKEFVDQVCQDTGGPCTYTGLNMRQAHTNMG
jgi:hemoglobin